MAQLLLKEGVSQATPPAGYVTTYAKADGGLYSKDPLGVETPLGAAAANTLRSDLAAPSGSSLVGWIRTAVAAVATTLLKWVQRQPSSVFDFMTDAEVTDAQLGASAVLDHTAAIIAYKTHAIANLPFTMNFPKGWFRYSSLGNLAYAGLTIRGVSERETVLRCTGAGKALNLDAFAAGFTGNDATAPFVQKCNLENITVQGNAGTTVGIFAQGLARCAWKNVTVREGEPTAGIAFQFDGVMLSKFYNLICSTDLDPMASKPFEGLRLEPGTRNFINVGNASNNVFVGPYLEGLNIGIRLAGADQNVFEGGSPESCSQYGLLVNSLSRYNTFIGTGFENLGATADIADTGIYNKFINIYSSQKVILQGRGAEISGGFFERIQVDAGAFRNKVKSVTINNWATGAGGLFDSGTGTVTSDIYDADLSAYVAEIWPRFLTNVPASVTNSTGNGLAATLGLVEVYDDNNNFSANTFTAPVTGRYVLNAVVSLDALSTAATLTTLRIVTSNRTFLTQKGLNPKAGGLQDSVSMSVVADMAAGNTATVTIQVDGMAGNTATIIGNASTMWTTFSGARVG